MGFFDKLFGGAALKSCDEVHPVLGPALATLRAQDGRQAPAVFIQARNQGDFGLCTKLVLVSVSDYVSKFHETMREQMIDGLLASDPFWQLVRGRWRFEEGWKARGTGRSGSVSDDGWRILEERCRGAQRDFEELAARDPQNPVPHVLMLDVLRGLGLEEDETRRRANEVYARATATDPLLYDAHVRMLSIVSGRWYGTHDEMRALALRVSSGAPEGTDAASLPVEAHWDHYTQTKNMDKNDAAAAQHLANPAVQQEIATACARSVDSPSYRPTTNTLTIRHRIAALAWAMGDQARVRHQLSQVQDSFFKAPWAQLDWKNTEPFYKTVRKQVGLG